MNKRFVSVFATLLCVLLCAFGFVACDDDSGKNGGGNGGGNGGAQTVAVESVTLNKTELTLEIGGEETLTATVTPENATDKTVVWSSDNTAVATVANGKVTAVAAGTATVTATADGKSATCSVTVNAPAPTTEVTAEQWAQIMESADNFTYIENHNNRTGTVKIVGSTIMLSRDGKDQIFVKEGNEYYTYDNGNGSWKKSSTSESAYNNVGIIARFVFYFKDDFASFTYADGKYTASSLDKTATMNGVLNDVEVTFENGALVEIKFSVLSGSGTTCEINNFGTTNITLPAEYTDNTASSQNSVAGKTFVFKDVTCQSSDADDSVLTQMKEANNGATFAFGTDGTIIYTMPAQSVVQKLTYVQNGATITYELVEMKVNGEDMPIGEQVPQQFTVENNEIVMETTNKNSVYAAVYELQSAE